MTVLSVFMMVALSMTSYFKSRTARSEYERAVRGRDFVDAQLRFAAADPTYYRAALFQWRLTGPARLATCMDGSTSGPPCVGGREIVPAQIKVYLGRQGENPVAGLPGTPAYYDVDGNPCPLTVIPGNPASPGNQVTNNTCPIEAYIEWEQWVCYDGTGATNPVTGIPSGPGNCPNATPPPPWNIVPGNMRAPAATVIVSYHVRQSPGALIGNRVTDANGTLIGAGSLSEVIREGKPVDVCAVAKNVFCP